MGPGPGLAPERRLPDSCHIATASALFAARASAGQDPAATAILLEAGRELGRLARALIERFGPRPVALSGRAADLHPAIAASMRASLPTGTIITQSAMRAHHAAARLAAHDGATT